MKTLRTLLPYMTAIFVIAALYATYVVVSRWNQKRDDARAAKSAEVEADRRIVDRLGGGKLKILSFWAEPGHVRPGARALVCFGVANAKTVRIEPHIQDIMPALSQCLEVYPKKTTEYKLTAEDGAGHSETGSIVLQVK